MPLAKTRADFQHLAAARAREAKALLDAGEWAGAYYLAGYAVECALKSCIIKRLMSSDEWPEKKFTENCWKHDLILLLGLAGLDTAMVGAGPAVQANWGIVEDWSEQSRYEVGRTENEARRCYAAVTDTADGILLWLQARW